MSFLYPLFLLAGLTIAIPVVIHLFNLRRYKTVFFPSTRFLKSIQLHSQKQSQVRYKWLLALRILFLLALILAFAQPFFSSADKAEDNRLQVIYLDNSSSMSVKKGARTLLDVAKESARAQLMQAPAGARFLVLTNDKPPSYQPVPVEKALAYVNNVELCPLSRSSAQVLATVQGITQSEAAGGADLYYYSDFQRSGFDARPVPTLMQGVRFFGRPVRQSTPRNIFIDTAYLAAPTLQAGQNNRLIVTSRLVGKQSDETSVLQLSVNGQVKSATTIAWNERNESTDTLSFQPDGAAWQKIAVVVNDASVRFDDTFRISARSASNLSILVLNQAQPNPFIQAAFRSYEGFRLDQRSLTESGDWLPYNLVILNGITSLSEETSRRMPEALQRGQSVCIFPGRTSDLGAFNSALARIADIRITGVDTVAQPATTLQQGSELVRDLFERIPENVQLPVANWHYQIAAGLSANQQSVLSFRNGDPLLAQYTPFRGKLYVLATSADITGGNFPGSYFFVPFLYQMAAQAKGGDVYAITAGRQQPVFLSLNNAGDRNMVHVRASGVDVIPPQRPSGAGLEVFLGQAVQQPGFYTLAAQGSDSTVVALNNDRSESLLELWDMEQLQANWKGPAITWSTSASVANGGQAGAALPLWKVCVILALLMLAAETFVLAAGYRKQTVAPR